MVAPLLLLVFFLPQAQAASLNELSCGIHGSGQKPTTYAVLKNGTLALKDAGLFDNRQDCETALAAAKANAGNFACAPSSLILNNMFGVYNFETGAQIGRSIFNRERCEEFAQTGKPGFLCAYDHGVASTSFVRYNAKGEALSKSKYPSLAACTHVSQEAAPAAAEPANSSAE